LQQGYLGIAAQASTAANQQGVTIGGVQQSSGATQAGLRAGDVITAINGNAVTDYASLAARISGNHPYLIFRRGGCFVPLSEARQAAPIFSQSLPHRFYIPPLYATGYGKQHATPAGPSRCRGE
jgi:hypothetical protein